VLLATRRTVADSSYPGQAGTPCNLKRLASRDQLTNSSPRSLQCGLAQIRSCSHVLGDLSTTVSDDATVHVQLATMRAAAPLPILQTNFRAWILKCMTPRLDIRVHTTPRRDGGGMEKFHPCARSPLGSSALCPPSAQTTCSSKHRRFNALAAIGTRKTAFDTGATCTKDWHRQPATTCLGEDSCHVAKTGPRKGAGSQHDLA
jgi:hypothetical protein